MTFNAAAARSPTELDRILSSRITDGVDDVPYDRLHRTSKGGSTMLNKIIINGFRLTRDPELRPHSRPRHAGGGPSPLAV